MQELRLIDANKVLDIVMAYCPDDDGSCSKAGVDLREMLDEIEALPEIDAKPAKYGQWVHDGGGYDGRDNWYHCSECNRTLNLICGRKLEDFPYCHCGAKMNGDVDK